MNKRLKKLSHIIYECKCNIVICPKYRFQIFADAGAKYIKQQTYILCHQKKLVAILEFNIQKDHIYVVMWIPPQYSIIRDGVSKREAIIEIVSEI